MSELVRRAVLDKRFWPGVAMAALIGGSLSVAGVATADTVDEADPAAQEEAAQPADTEAAEQEEGRDGGPFSGGPHHHDDNGSGVHSETEDSEFHEVCDTAGPGGSFIGPCPRPAGGGGGGGAVGGAPEELAVTGPSEDLALVGGAIALTGGVVMYITRRRSERAEDAEASA
ncbi:hypothetical protein KIK06_18850 [Nocardiopsis sp. EMB25]|uniref:hypothetical protein n=1 Tax=Nocardiopsis TaxID=2013 RepID=UPI00034B9C7B|nr:MULTISPECIES: hypothetical protein [Nocardiopsis]MCY9785952.1 hypothetical protein [Nocardiopsis sp. EMB25]